MVATTLLAISPGPDNIYVLTLSIRRGKWSGLSTVFGLISGCIVHTVLVAFGVSALIKANEDLFLVLKILGAAYLIFLAWNVFRSEAVLNLNANSEEKNSYRQLFIRGFFMNVLNPKVSLFFLALFPGFLFSETMETAYQFFLLGLIFMLVSLIIFGIIAVLAGSIANYLNRSSKVALFLKWLQILVFVGIAVFILLSEN